MNGTVNGDHESGKITVHVEKVANTSEFPYTGREGQVACSVGNKVYIFGGVEQGQWEEPKETNELLMFDLDTRKWSRPNVSGTLPPSRSAGSFVAVGTSLYLFGGLSHMSGWFDDTFIFDTVTSTWAILETEGTKPRARDKLQAVAIDSKIYYFGGFGPKSDEAEAVDLGADSDDDEEFEDIPESQEQDGAEFGWFNDLYILDTETLKWSQPMQMNLGVPTQRAAHGMCAIGRNLVIFGGRDIEDRQNDLHIFNVDTRKWITDLKVSGDAPAARSFHTLTSVGNRAVLFGGRGRDHQHFSNFDVFDFDKKEWVPTTITGCQPAGRGLHCTVCVGDKIFLFGGSGDFSAQTMQCQTFYSDAFVIETGL
ncbi:kelch domain-containing protein 2 isoform X2 [Aplysia californica]|uniref:Kelch domain-containing protein 2 isoform X2 n=1 Tax=Aplysia californica TaxID=6500 RepID=A0ABM0JQ37_APLCA|nr:kelch domain-containing protein 2 isoform X2 [Aplysia californica]